MCKPSFFEIKNKPVTQEEKLQEQESKSQQPESKNESAERRPTFPPGDAALGCYR
ncbi:MAG: hypothetical protein SFW66_00525 [Gammaproteobacteria bacterium]|nr:hypothetical protein [Gammaproteobacteria bacterium]